MGFFHSLPNKNRISTTAFPGTVEQSQNPCTPSTSSSVPAAVSQQEGITAEHLDRIYKGFTSALADQTRDIKQLIRKHELLSTTVQATVASLQHIVPCVDKSGDETAKAWVSKMQQQVTAWQKNNQDNLTLPPNTEDNPQKEDDSSNNTREVVVVVAREERCIADLAQKVQDRKELLAQGNSKDCMQREVGEEEEIQEIPTNPQGHQDKDDVGGGGGDAKEDEDDEAVDDTVMVHVDAADIAPTTTTTNPIMDHNNNNKSCH